MTADEQGVMGLREKLAEALLASCPRGSGPCDRCREHAYTAADALLPLVEQEVREGAAVALEEAAEAWDEQLAGRLYNEPDPYYWLRDRAGSLRAGGESRG